MEGGRYPESLHCQGEIATMNNRQKRISQFAIVARANVAQKGIGRILAIQVRKLEIKLFPKG